MTKKEIEKFLAEANYRQKKAKMLNKEWYSIRSMLGVTWALFYILLGAREAGKSYAVMYFFVWAWKRFGIPFTWLRMKEPSQKKLLANNAAKLVDPDIRRKFDLDLTVKGFEVFDHGKPMARVLALSTFYNDKGVALYDCEYGGYYHICCDEMNLEQSEKRTFDPLYNLVNQLENLMRSRKDKTRIFLIGNTLQEASDILCAFGFIPEEFGRYYVHKKRAVIDYMPPSQKYLERRDGTVADLLSPSSSTFTNQTNIDISLVYKCRLTRPKWVIKFTKDKADWFTVWEGNIIARYNGERCPVIAMRPYLDEVFVQESRDSIVTGYDSRLFYYHDLFTQKNFGRCLALVKPRK